MLYNSKNIDYEKFTFKKAIKGKDGKYFIASSIQEDDEVKNEILTQLGQIECKTNMVDQESQEQATSLDFVLDNLKQIEFISEMDEHMLICCKEHKEEWFPGQELSDSYLDSAFMPSIRSTKKGSKQVLKTRVSSTTLIYNSDKEVQEPTVVTSGIKVSTIACMAGLWFTKTRFGITWKVRQIKVQKEPKKIRTDYLFEDAESDEELDNVFPDE